MNLLSENVMIPSARGSGKHFLVYGITGSTRWEGMAGVQ